MELSLKYFIKTNIRNLTVVFISLAVLVTLITIVIFPTLINLFIYYKLDYEEAFNDISLRIIHGRSDVYLSKPTKAYAKTQSMFEYMNVYKQNNRYKFRIKPEDVFDLNIFYETTIENDKYTANSKIRKYVNYKYLALYTDNIYILTRVKPDFEITPNHEYKGVFVPLAKELMYKLEGALGDDRNLENVFMYEFDTTNSFSFYRFTDFAYLFVTFTILIVLGIKLIIYKTNYRNHPTYKLLEKMPNEPHEMEAFINSELADKENVSVNKNVYTTKNWMITKGFYKTNICRTGRSVRFGE